MRPARLQGLSPPPRRGAHATLSRDLTLGVWQEKEPRQTVSPKIPKVQLGKTAEGEPRATGRRQKTGFIEKIQLLQLGVCLQRLS